MILPGTEGKNMMLMNCVAVLFCLMSKLVNRMGNEAMYTTDT